MIDKDLVWEKLKVCLDPELGMSIVDLGLVYDVVIDQNEKLVKVVLTLTTPGCPLSPYFAKEVTKRVKEISEVSGVEVNLTFDPPWTPEMIKSDEIRLMLGI